MQRVPEPTGTGWYRYWIQYLGTRTGTAAVGSGTRCTALLNRMSQSETAIRPALSAVLRQIDWYAVLDLESSYTLAAAR